MHAKSIFPSKCSSRGKLKGDARTNIKNQLRIRYGNAGIVLAIFLVSLSFCGIANADYFPPALPASNIVSQTFVSTALTTPTTTVYINVTEYDAQQMVNNITMDFREPISYVSLVVDILRDKPLIVNAPKTAPIIQYYDIRYLTELADKIRNVTVAFAVEKAILQNMSVREDSLLLYQYNGSKFVACPIQKVAENETYVFFKTQTTVYPLFAITGSTVPSPWWSSLLPVAAIPLLAIIAVYFYRRYKLKRSLDLVTP
jgi:PGF-pre-PGF domain-containing protein